MERFPTLDGATGLAAINTACATTKGTKPFQSKEMQKHLLCALRARTFARSQTIELA
jgi:hypothetical protein